MTDLNQIARDHGFSDWQNFSKLNPQTAKERLREPGIEVNSDDGRASIESLCTICHPEKR